MSGAVAVALTLLVLTAWPNHADAVPVTVGWNFTGGNEACGNLVAVPGNPAGCTTAEFNAMPPAKEFASSTPDATRSLEASAWAAANSSVSSVITSDPSIMPPAASFKVGLGHYAEGLGVTVARTDDPRLDKDGRLEYLMFELGADNYDPLKLQMNALAEPGGVCASDPANPTGCFFHDVDLRIWIGGAGPGGSLYSGDGGMAASATRLNSGAFTIGGVGFTQVFQGGNFTQSNLSIFLCDGTTGTAAYTACASGGGVGGTTGRYVIIDWPDAAFITTFQAQVQVPTQEQFIVPAPPSILLIGSTVILGAVLALGGRRFRYRTGER